MCVCVHTVFNNMKTNCPLGLFKYTTKYVHKEKNNNQTCLLRAEQVLEIPFSTPTQGPHNAKRLQSKSHSSQLVFLKTGL